MEFTISVFDRNSLFGQICSENSKLSLQPKIWIVMVTFPVLYWKYNFCANLVRKSKYSGLSWNLITQINLNMQSSMVFTFFSFWLEILFLGTFSPKNQLRVTGIIAITGATQDTSREKSFMELGLELLKWRRRFTHLCCMFKIMKNQAPEYLKNLIPKC